MEAALKVFAGKAEFDHVDSASAWPRVDEVPFDTRIRFMATLHHDHHGHGIAYLKGAPERILAMCAHQVSTDGGTEPLSTEHWERIITEMASEGLRCWHWRAGQWRKAAGELVLEELEQGAELLGGVVGLLDPPPRQEAIRAIKECHDAGIRVKMITGDHALTAGAIARKLGLRNADRVLTGKELDDLDEDQLRSLAGEVDVFARTSPPSTNFG